jgi:iron complex transport system substrate-binding protein
MKRCIAILMVVVLLFCVIGCTNSDKSNTNQTNTDQKKSSIEVTGDQYPLTITDYFNKEIILETAPKKVAVLSGSHINIWYDLGGKSICTSNISDNLKILSKYEDEIKGLPSVGEVYQVNLESIVKLQPDLIIAQVGCQNIAAEELSEMGFPVISVQLKNYQDVKNTYAAFGKILQKDDLANEKIATMENDRENLIAKKPKEEKTVVVLYLTSKSLAVKLDNSIAGDVCKSLGLKNIASNLPADTIGSESTPLDIEYIIQQNPDYVLVASMIANNDAAIETMTKQFNENPAWKSVKAIQEGQVGYLPQEYFLYNAGPYYCEAIEYVGRLIYPEIYGEVDNWYGK